MDSNLIKIQRNFSSLQMDMIFIENFLLKMFTHCYGNMFSEKKTRSTIESAEKSCSLVYFVLDTNECQQSTQFANCHLRSISLFGTFSAQFLMSLTVSDFVTK